MGIFSRMTDIINSNLTALLDRAEDPEKMIRLMIQEMEDTLVEVRTTSARSIAERKALQRRHEALQEEMDEWTRKAELALRREREDLARAALLQRRELTEDAVALEQELVLLDDSVARLADDIARLEAKLRDARSRQQSLAARGRTARSQSSLRRQVQGPRIDAALGRFEQYERHVEGLEGQVDAYTLGGAGLADEIAGLEAEERLQAELEALRQRVREADGERS